MVDAPGVEGQRRSVPEVQGAGDGDLCPADPAYPRGVLHRGALRHMWLGGGQVEGEEWGAG